MRFSLSRLVPVLIACALSALPLDHRSEAACPAGTSVPVTSGTGLSGVPVVFSFKGSGIQGSFFLLGSGDANNSGTLPTSVWLVALGDLDGDGRTEYRIAAPAEGVGGWGDSRVNGCPATAQPAYPPLVVILYQPREDLDGDGAFDVFEDINHNGRLDLGEDRDGDGRLTPAIVHSITGPTVGCEGATREDVDCDGHPDLIYEDRNHNGILDAGEDVDGDGRLDYIDEDKNNNGKLDPGEDLNGNGILDTYDPVRLPAIHPYIEDRNNDQILNDRPFPSPNDVIYAFVENPDGTTQRVPIEPNYPYRDFRPAPGGLVVASVAWNGVAYDFDTIDTPTRLITLTDGRRFRVVDAAPLDTIVPRISAFRQDEKDWPYRMHIEPSRLPHIDDAGGRRPVFDEFDVTVFRAVVGFLETFLESMSAGIVLPEGGSFASIISRVIPGPFPLNAGLRSGAQSAGSNQFLSYGGALPKFQVFNLVDQDDDGFPLPFDNCPLVPNAERDSSGRFQRDANQDGLGDVCDPASDPVATIGSSWADHLANPDPDPMSGAAAAYDAARGLLVAFGGSGLTWEYDGHAWTVVPTGSVPTPRFGHRMVYDGVHRRILLFGGFDLAGSALNDLWQYAAGAWSRIDTPIAPPVQPPGSTGPGLPSFGLAFDSARGLLVLFGGDDTGRTWVFDGTNWKLVPSPRAPLPRTQPEMTYDAFRQVTVLHGGRATQIINGNVVSRLIDDTWEFDGHTWQEVDTRGDRPPSWGGVTGFDPARRLVLDSGGELLRIVPPGGPGQSINLIPQRWAATGQFDGLRWSFLPTRPTALPSAGPWGAFDSVRDVLVVHGSLVNPDGSMTGYTAELHQPSDSDGDGVRDAEDNCPLLANSDQTDRDHDGSGDACDNCPDLANSTQRDLDGDGTGDVCDDDIDGDGVPNHDDPCPAAYVAGRSADAILGGGGPDSDGDGTPDDCDKCPHDPDNDADNDGLCADADNCPATYNPLQEDSNRDGSGDACQPVLVLLGVQQDGGDVLEVSAEAHDPDGDPLSGTIEFFRTIPITLRAVDLDHPTCDTDVYPAGTPGQGIAYDVVPGYRSVLIDLDSALGCQDGVPDYLVSLGRCAESLGFEGAAQFPGPAPFPVCIGRYDPSFPSTHVDPASLVDLTVAEFNDQFVRLVFTEKSPALSIPFAGGLPGQSDISTLTPGTTYRFVITVTDGSSVPVSAETTVLYQGERTMVINGGGPHAVITGPSAAECTGPGGAVVVLDGSGSGDPQPGQGSLTYAWYEDLGLPTQRPLGADRILTATLPLGGHQIFLRITDAAGLSDTAHVSVLVRDTTPPALTVVADPAVLWPPNHRLVPVRISWQLHDTCDPAPGIVLVSATSSEADDAAGDGDGRTAGDLAGVDIGTADAQILLRAERAATGTGRQYVLTYRAMDASGNSASGLAVVTVPLGGLSSPSGADFGAAAQRPARQARDVDRDGQRGQQADRPHGVFGGTAPRLAGGRLGDGEAGEAEIDIQDRAGHHADPGRQDVGAE